MIEKNKISEFLPIRPSIFFCTEGGGNGNLSYCVGEGTFDLDHQL